MRPFTGPDAPLTESQAKHWANAQVKLLQRKPELLQRKPEDEAQERKRKKAKVFGEVDRAASLEMGFVLDNSLDKGMDDTRLHDFKVDFPNLRRVLAQCLAEKRDITMEEFGLFFRTLVTTSDKGPKNTCLLNFLINHCGSNILPLWDPFGHGSHN